MSLIMFTGNLHAIISAILLQLVLFCKWKILHICKYSNTRDLTSLNVVTLALKKEKSLVQRRHSHRICYKTQSNFLQLYLHQLIYDFLNKSVYVLITRPGLLEAWLMLTSVKYHGSLYILIPLNQRLALTRLRATGPRSLECLKLKLFLNIFLHVWPSG